MRTVLYDRHVSLGGKIVPFAGWDMPVQYKGIIAEHHAVRNGVGMFDVSHMGRIIVEGPDAEPFLDYISTNIIAHKPTYTSVYTVWCHKDGGCVDDVLVYKESPTSFFVIVNAANRQKDLSHLKSHAQDWNVKINDRFEQDGIISLQGPLAGQVLFEFVPEASTLEPFHFLRHGDTFVSRTGYTGAGGFELYAPNAIIVDWWDRFLGRGVEPIGLGARDTLRLESGFALYGHEISNTIAPTESVSAWTVKFQKENFLGKQALERLDKSPDKRAEYGIVLLDPGIAREGYPVYLNNNSIGAVTSGTFSPTLNKAIALILVKGALKEGDVVEVLIRQNRCRAEIVKIPFVRKVS